MEIEFDVHVAAINGRDEEVRGLLERGASVTSTCGYFETLLHYACPRVASDETSDETRGQIRVMKVLIDKGANVNAVSERSGETPLHMASTSVGAARLLIENGAIVNVANYEGVTPLHLSSRNGCADVVKLLIDKRANVDSINDNGDTPLLEASYCSATEDTGEAAPPTYDYAAVVMMLVAKGANTNHANKNSETPLYRACDAGNQEIAEILIRKGADVNFPNKYGTTPLHRCGSGGHELLGSFLIKEGANVGAVSAGGRTPLNDACYWGHPEVATMLLDNGANVNVVDGVGNTPLHDACQDVQRRRKDEALVQLLLDRGAKVNASNKKGQIPLHLLFLNDSTFQDMEPNKIIGLARILLNSGAKLNTTDNNGKTPADVALTCSHRIFQVLKAVKLQRAFVGICLAKNAMRRARIRASERLYKPGGLGYYGSKQRFESVASNDLSN